MSRHSSRSKNPQEAGFLDGIDDHVDRAVEEFPEIDPSVEQIVSRVEKLARYINKSASETLAHHRLTDGEYKVLVKLRLAGEPYQASPGELSEHVMLSTGAMTNRLDRLEERGFVVRKPDPHDRRGVLVEITPAGQDVLVAAVREQAAKEIRLLEGLPESDRPELIDLLRKVLIRLQDVMGPPPRHEEPSTD
jgi:DNA-binding MarR family transcriptional regulator